jgi:hypothetical protein
LGEDLDGGGGGPHAEEEWAHDVNLDDERAGGVDLDGRCMLEAHREEERGAWREP